MVEKELSEYELYMSIIDDVISNVRNTFIEDGKDELILQELKEMWQEKLIKSNVVDPAKKSQSFNRTKVLTLAQASPSPLINVRIQRPQVTNRPITCTHLLAQKNIVPTSVRQKPADRMIVVHNPTNSTVTGQQCLRLPPSIRQTLLLQPGLLPQVVAGNQSPILSVHQFRTQVARPLQVMSQALRSQQQQQILVPTPRIIQIQSPVQRFQPTGSNLLNIRLKAPANGQLVLTTNQPQVAQVPLGGSIIRLNTSMTPGQLTIQRLPINSSGILAPRLVLPQTQRLRQVDGPALTELMDEFDEDEEEEILDMLSDSDSELAEEAEEAVALDDLNPPTMEEIEDLMDCDNLLVCLFKKVEKKKEKFKMVLKFGILCIDGKENVFTEASGVADLKMCGL